MNKTLSEAKSFVKEVKDLVPANEKMESVICAPALFLDSLVEVTKGTDVKIGAQNMHFEENGAFTGEISPMALQILVLNMSLLVIQNAVKCLMKQMKR